MPRWSGPGKNSTPGHRWRDEVCEFCGKKYKRFRIADELPWVHDPWKQAMEELILEREPPGSDDPPDPNRPVNRRAVLGRMFQYKQEAWKKHLKECEEVYMLVNYVNKFTGARAELVNEENEGGEKFYTLRLENGEENRWAEAHFKRCWKSIADDFAG